MSVLLLVVEPGRALWQAQPGGYTRGMGTHTAGSHIGRDMRVRGSVTPCRGNKAQRFKEKSGTCSTGTVATTERRFSHSAR
ncbi:MAG: hypothetical protein V7642_2889 [Burkholderiales bacterium]